MLRTLLYALCAATCGCQTILGIEQLSPDASVEDTSVTFASGECSSCLRRTCDVAEQACIADRPCRAVHRCVAPCAQNDIRCRSNCEGADVETATGKTYRAFDDCRRRTCARECLGLGGARSLVGDSCACLDEKCSKELADCIVSGAAGTGTVGGCERRNSCMVRLGLSPASTMMCETREPTGTPEQTALSRCVVAAACGGCDLVAGNVFSCVDSYLWERPAPATVQFTATVSSFPTAKPLDARVTACPFARCNTCDEGSLDAVSKSTDPATGKFTLDLPIGFQGCQRVTAGAAFVDTLEFLGRPLVRSEDRWGFGLYERKTLADMGAALGVAAIAGRGHTFIGVLDCVLNPAAGVRIEAAPSLPDTRAIYVASGFPSLEAKLTDKTGAAALLNLPTGLVTLRGYLGDRLVSSQKVWIRPDPSSDGVSVASFVTMLPSERTR